MRLFNAYTFAAAGVMQLAMSQWFVGALLLYCAFTHDRLTSTHR